MGASFRHPAFHVTAEELFAFVAANGVELWGADTDGEPVDGITAPEKLGLAVGNEGAGLSSSLRERVTRSVSLPIAGAVESLNVAVATGILLYQLRT
jgi:tRNA G18 (ribose-2'-O)-methylase SpoU